MMDGDPGDGFLNSWGPIANIGRVYNMIPLLDGVLDILGLFDGDSMMGAGQMAFDV